GELRLPGHEERQPVGQNRAAQRHLEDVLVEVRIPAVVEPAEVVALVGEGAGELVAAFAGLDAHHSGCDVAELGPDAARRDLDVLEGIRPHVDAEAGARQRVLRGDAIHIIARLVRTAAADVQARRVADHAGLRGDDILHVAQRRRLDLLSGHRIGARGLFHIDQRALAHDDDLLAVREHGLAQLDIQPGRFAVYYAN